MRKKSFIIKTVVGFIGLFLIFELLFRFANPVDCLQRGIPWAQEQWHHSPQPGQLTLKHGATTISYYINAFGLRGQEISKNKAPGTRRILILGDSFVFGEGVAEEETWIRQLAMMLAKADTAKSFELINGGMWGYSPLLSYLWFKQRLMYLKPDGVVQCIFSNDISDDFAFSLIADYDPNGEIQRVPHHFKPVRLPVKPILNRKNWLFKHSHAVKYFVWLVEEIFPPQRIWRQDDILTDPYAHCRKNPPNWHPHYQRTLHYLTQTANLCRQKGIPYAATLLPNPAQLTSEYLYRILAEGAQKHQFRFWNLYHQFQKQLSPSCFHPAHGHLTVAGNKQMAEILLPHFHHFILQLSVKQFKSESF